MEDGKERERDSKTESRETDIPGLGGERERGRWGERQKRKRKKQGLLLVERRGRASRPLPTRLLVPLPFLGVVFSQIGIPCPKQSKAERLKPKIDTSE